MSFLFEELHKHQKEQNAIVRKILKEIAKENGTTYHDSIQGLIGQSENLTILFWLKMNEQHPNKFNRVGYCASCRKFDLDFEAD